MAPIHPQLVWPRSDGNPDLWPPQTRAENSGWFEPLAL